MLVGIFCGLNPGFRVGFHLFIVMIREAGDLTFMESAGFPVFSGRALSHALYSIIISLIHILPYDPQAILEMK